jgi:hypothetical protein
MPDQTILDNSHASKPEDATKKITVPVKVTVPPQQAAAAAVPNKPTIGLKRVISTDKALFMAAGVSAISIGAIAYLEGMPTTDTLSAPIQVPVASKITESMSFKDAFDAARGEVGGGGGCFNWHGHVYNTYTESEWTALKPEQQQSYSANLKNTPMFQSYEKELQSKEHHEVHHEPTTPSHSHEAVAEPEVVAESQTSQTHHSSDVVNANYTPDAHQSSLNFSKVTQVQQFDISGDGVMDAALVNTDNDDYAEAVAIDINQDNSVDAVILDTDGDNMLDSGVKVDAQGHFGEIIKLAEPIQAPSMGHQTHTPNDSNVVDAFKMPQDGHLPQDSITDMPTHGVDNQLDTLDSPLDYRHSHGDIVDSHEFATDDMDDWTNEKIDISVDFFDTDSTRDSYESQLESI